MCIRVGIDWYCEHKWRGWLPCRFSIKDNKIGDKCRYIDRKQTIDPHPEHQIRRVKSEAWLLKPKWCCSPQCCLHKIRPKEPEINAYVDEYNRQCEEHGTLVSRDGERYRRMAVPMKHYNVVINQHYDLCVNTFMAGLGRLNSMRVDMGEGPRNDVVPWPDLKCLTDLMQTRYTYDGTYDRLMSHQRAIQDGGGSQPLSRDSLAQYLAIREYLLVTTSTAIRFWQPPRSAPRLDAETLRQVRARYGGPSMVGLSISTTIAPGEPAVVGPSGSAFAGPSESGFAGPSRPVVASTSGQGNLLSALAEVPPGLIQNTTEWEPQDLVPPIDFGALQEFLEDDENKTSQLEESLTPFIEDDYNFESVLPSAGSNDLYDPVSGLWLALQSLNPFSNYTIEERQFIYSSRHDRYSRLCQQIGSLVARAINQHTGAQVPEAQQQQSAELLQLLRQVQNFLESGLQEMNEWFDRPQTQQQRQRIPALSPAPAADARQTPPQQLVLASAQADEDDLYGITDSEGSDDSDISQTLGGNYTGPGGRNPRPHLPLARG